MIEHFSQIRIKCSDGRVSSGRVSNSAFPRISDVIRFPEKNKKPVIFSLRGLRPVLKFLFPEEKCDISKQTNLFLTTVVLEKWLKPAAVFTEWHG